MSAISRGLLSLVVIAIIMPLTDRTARTQQDLDQNMSGAKLFSATCAGCHRSPRGLAKARFSWTLSSYLPRHDTSSPAAARTLTADLQSADVPRAKSQPTARKSRPAAKGATEPPLRPPAPVPGR
jgi:hypothetical protein